MAYHYDNRRLNFLRSPELVQIVQRLGEFETAEEALATLAPTHRSVFARALGRLAAGDFLEPVSP